MGSTPRNPLQRLLAGARTRVLLAFVVLLAFSTALSVFAIRELLLVRTGDRVDAALTQDLDEFRTLVRGVLETFLRHPAVLSREQQLSHVWGYDFDSAASNVVDV